MVPKITHARSNESGKATKGRAGDQTGGEICTTDIYNHAKGWYVLRPKTKFDAENIATAAETIADNDMFGYGQDTRETGVKASKAVNWNFKMVNKPCDFDCSSMVRACCLAAGIDVNDFYTGNEVDVLTKTGKFNLVSYSMTGVVRGDILVTKTTGHTAIVTTGYQTYTGKNGIITEGTNKYYYINGVKQKKYWLHAKDGAWYRFGNNGEMLKGYHLVTDKDGKSRPCFFDNGTGALYHEAPDHQGYLEVWYDK